MRFTATEKMEIIRIVELSEWGVRKTLNGLGIHSSTFYNWYNRYKEDGIEGLKPKKTTRKQYWNKIPDEIRSSVIDLALDVPELSSRELACKYTDEQGYYISESSVYRILKKAGLINPPPFDIIKAADKYKDPTNRINEMSDFTYFKIIGWGWYYLFTVLDDYSRYIISWELCTTMKAGDVKSTLDKALNHHNVTLKQPPKLLSDNGSAYLSKELGSYLQTFSIKHVRGRLAHPQTQGKIERYHRTMKNVIKLENYYSPDQLRHRLKEFVEYYNYQRYHESLENLTPADIYYGKKEYRLEQRRKCKMLTLQKRKQEYITKSFKSMT